MRSLLCTTHSDLDMALKTIEEQGGKAGKGNTSITLMFVLSTYYFAKIGCKINCEVSLRLRVCLGKKVLFPRRFEWLERQIAILLRVFTKMPREKAFVALC